MEVKINIVTKQYDENSNVDTISLNTDGNLYLKNDEIYIAYKETEDGNEITSTIKISKDEISIKKFGSVNSTMTFKENQNSVTKYKTPQGLFIIETETNSLVINKTRKDIIQIDVEYNIKIMDLFQGRNEISILIQNKE